MRTRLLFALAAVLSVLGSGEAATIHLRSAASVSGTIVTLGDVATISAADEELIGRIEAIELFPAPRGDAPRHVTIREIQDILFNRGVNLARHEFSGASRVSVASARKGENDSTVSRAILRSATAKAAEAISAYLVRVDPRQGWRVELELDAAAAEAISRARREIEVTGTQRPSSGTHHFELEIDGNEGRRSLTVAAVLSREASVVVATRSLGIGERIGPSDVRLVPPGNPAARGTFQSVDEVLGMEMGRSIPEGRPLTRDSVIQPILVNNGKVVSVRVHGGGIRLRTNARARQDGAMGDVITVESPTNRAKYLARVVGPNEVEVCNILSRTE